MWSAVCSMAPHSQFVMERGPFVHGQMKTSYTSPQAIEPYPRCSGQTHSNWLWTDPGCFTRMSSSDKLSNSFHTAGTNGRLDVSLLWRASCCPTNCACSTWSGSWIARFAKESVAPNRRNSAGWMPAKTGKSSLVWDASIQWQCAKHH